MGDTMGRVGYTFTLLKEFFRFARAHTVYWIVPMVVVLAFMVLLVVTGQFSAPFIYTLF
jgi:hypothetical protein